MIRSLRRGYPLPSPGNRETMETPRIEPDDAIPDEDVDPPQPDPPDPEHVVEKKQEED